LLHRRFVVFSDNAENAKSYRLANKKMPLPMK